MDSVKTPLAAAVFMEVVFVICRLAVWLFPNASKAITQSWFHGVDLSTSWNPSVSSGAGVFLLGAVSAFIGTYIAVWIFVLIYKAIVK